MRERQRADHPHNDEFTAAPGARRLLTELVGTFALTSVAAGIDTTARLSGGQVDLVARALAPALLVMAFIYALGDVSGAHFNPAVSLGFALRRLFPVSWMFQYWVAQLAGAALAGLSLVLVFGAAAAEAGVDTPHVPADTALVVEIFLSWVLLTVILGTADRHRLIGPNAALAVAGAIALCGLGAKVVSGASMNPARSFGPAIATGKLGDLWIYLVSPFVGAVIAVVLMSLVHGSGAGDLERRKAATGEQSGGNG